MKYVKDTSFYIYFLWILFSIYALVSNHGTYMSVSCWDGTSAEALDGAWFLITETYIFAPTILVILYFIKSLLNKEWSLIPFYKSQNRNLWWFPILMILVTGLLIINALLAVYASCFTFN